MRRRRAGDPFFRAVQRRRTPDLCFCIAVHVVLPHARRPTKAMSAILVSQRLDRLQASAGNGRMAAEARSCPPPELAGSVFPGVDRERVVPMLLEIGGEEDGAVDGDRQAAVPTSKHHGAHNELRQGRENACKRGGGLYKSCTSQYLATDSNEDFDALGCCPDSSRLSRRQRRFRR